MKLSKRDQLYGAVLRKLAQHGTYAVREVGDKAGHFRINDYTYLLIKYATSSGSSWRFTFRPEDIKVLVADHNRSGLFGGSYICLICGTDVICSLAPDEWAALLDLADTASQQTIRVSRAAGCQLEVSGTFGLLPSKIAATRFPAIVLGRNMATRLAA